MKTFDATAFAFPKTSGSKLVHLIAVVSLASFAMAASAQYPDKPITLVVPSQAGSTVDTMARAVAGAAAAELGQTIVVDNKAGADGQIGCSDVAKAAPDGYRLLFATGGGLVGVPAMRRMPPYDAVKDFTPIAGVSEFSFFMLVHPSFPARDMTEFVNYVKAHPGKVDYATGNMPGWMSMAYLSRAAGLDMVRIAYKGEPTAVVDLLTNRVQAMFATSSSVLPHIKTGQLRALATTLKKRSNLLPDVPTMKEAGQIEMPFGGGWVSVFGPAGVPKDIVDRLSKAFIAAVNRPAVLARMDQFGLVPNPLTPDELGAYVKAQTIVYRDAVRDMQIPVE
jgi:tripartite-type tricarboxylate transporter receptor subunit TctC